MGWKQSMENLMDQLVESFVAIQTLNEFSTLELETKLKLCCVRINKIMDNVDERFRIILIDDKRYGLNGLLSDTVQLFNDGTLPSTPDSMKALSESQEEQGE